MGARCSCGQSYAGINFQKPIDEERLAKEIKRRKKT
jgi:hypothetical protein